MARRSSSNSHRPFQKAMSFSGMAPVMELNPFSTPIINKFSPPAAVFLHRCSAMLHYRSLVRNTFMSPSGSPIVSCGSDSLAAVHRNCANCRRSSNRNLFRPIRLKLVWIGRPSNRCKNGFCLLYYAFPDFASMLTHSNRKLRVSKHDSLSLPRVN
jgi:hypothetical protein